MRVVAYLVNVHLGHGDLDFLNVKAIFNSNVLVGFQIDVVGVQNLLEVFKVFLEFLIGGLMFCAQIFVPSIEGLGKFLDACVDFVDI